MVYFNLKIGKYLANICLHVISKKLQSILANLQFEGRLKDGMGQCRDELETLICNLSKNRPYG